MQLPLTLISILLAATSSATVVPRHSLELGLEARDAPAAPNGGNGGKPGPSGSLVSPKGGESLMSFSGTGVLPISYKTVTGDPTTGQTVFIGVSLEPVNGGETIELAQAYAGGNEGSAKGGQIDGVFGLPDGCGDYRVVITEHQLYQMSHISFRAAAPTVSISCGPIQK